MDRRLNASPRTLIFTSHNNTTFTPIRQSNTTTIYQSVNSTFWTDLELATFLDMNDKMKKQNSLYFYGTLPLIFFCIISVLVNLKILVSARWIRQPLSPTLHISLSLAGADAFTSVALCLGLVMNSFIPYGLGLKLSGTGCILLGLEAVRLGAVMITMGHLVTLAINHYLGILKPLHYLSIMTHRITTFLIILLWILPLCFFLAYFSLVENEGFQSKDCDVNSFLFKKKFRIMFSSLFFGPFVFMVFIYAHIFSIVRKHQASRLRFSQAGSSLRRNGSCNRQQHASQQIARNFKAVCTTLYILGSFVIGWMPATFLFVLVCEDCLLEFDSFTGNTKYIIYNTSNLLIILKTLVNPIIYAARMHEIQLAAKRMRSSVYGLLSLRKFARDRTAAALHSSDGLPSQRESIPKNDGSQCTNNIDEKRLRRASYRYTYRGLKRYSESRRVLRN